MGKLRNLVYASTLNVDKIILEENLEIKLEKWIFMLFLIALSWAYLYVQVIFAYQNIEKLGDKLFLWTKAFSYALLIILIISFITSLFIGNIKKKYSQRFYLSLIANSPVIIIALLSIFFNITYKNGNEILQMVGFFPENGFILAGFFTLFSNFKLVGRINHKLYILYFFIALLIQYIFQVIIFYKIFNLF